jgi:hypothetical protein
VLIALKSGNLILLETSGPVKACNGTALPFKSVCFQLFHTLIVLLNFNLIFEKFSKHKDWACSADGGGEEACRGFWWGYLRERNQWRDPGVDGRITLRWIFKK